MHAQTARMIAGNLVHETRQLYDFGILAAARGIGTYGIFIFIQIAREYADSIVIVYHRTLCRYDAVIIKKL